MWRSSMTVLMAVSLLGQEGIQWDRRTSRADPKGSSRIPSHLRSDHDIQKVKGPCRFRLIVASDALFGAETAEFAAGAEKVMSELGAIIRREGVHPISVDGFTDSAGVPDSNRKLSEDRARTVENWLEAREYVVSSVTEVHGYGMTKPIATNETPEGRQKNRRVEIVINTCKS